MSAGTCISPITSPTTPHLHQTTQQLMALSLNSTASTSSTNEDERSPFEIYYAPDVFPQLFNIVIKEVVDTHLRKPIAEMSVKHIHTKTNNSKDYFKMRLMIEETQDTLQKTPYPLCQKQDYQDHETYRLCVSAKELKKHMEDLTKLAPKDKKAEGALGRHLHQHITDIMQSCYEPERKTVTWLEGKNPSFHLEEIITTLVLEKLFTKPCSHSSSSSSSQQTPSTSKVSAENSQSTLPTSPSTTSSLQKADSILKTAIIDIWKTKVQKPLINITRSLFYDQSTAQTKINNDLLFFQFPSRNTEYPSVPKETPNDPDEEFLCCPLGELNKILANLMAPVKWPKDRQPDPILQHELNTRNHQINMDLFWQEGACLIHGETMMLEKLNATPTMSYFANNIDLAIGAAVLDKVIKEKTFDPFITLDLFHTFKQHEDTSKDHKTQ
jgi:hypothetical protein